MAADERFRAKYGPSALVAGAAVGLGAEYARQLAAKGLDLVLVDRDRTALERTAAEIGAAAGVAVRTAELDLGRADLAEAIAPATRGLEIGLLVYNAALGTVAPFLEIPPEHCGRMLDVNCRGPLLLVHALAPAMVARGRGGIVLMSSMSGRIGSSQLTVYAGTKAFDLVFAEALWAELREHGVDVLAVQPGSTRTPGWQSSQRPEDRGPGPHVMEPPDVVREALAALGREPAIVVGRENREAAEALAAMPLAQAIDLMSGITRELLPNHRRPL
jgi:short-subunit dehydrogenase